MNQHNRTLSVNGRTGFAVTDDKRLAEIAGPAWGFLEYQPDRDGYSPLAVILLDTLRQHAGKSLTSRQLGELTGCGPKVASWWLGELYREGLIRRRIVHRNDVDGPERTTRGKNELYVYWVDE